jgi:hypothetical protein
VVEESSGLAAPQTRRFRATSHLTVVTRGCTVRTRETACWTRCAILAESMTTRRKMRMSEYRVISCT